MCVHLLVCVGPFGTTVWGIHWWCVHSLLVLWCTHWWCLAENLTLRKLEAEENQLQEDEQAALAVAERGTTPLQCLSLSLIVCLMSFPEILTCVLSNSYLTVPHSAPQNLTAPHIALSPPVPHSTCILKFILNASASAS